MKKPMQQGFTLIEVLIVLGILAVLLSIGIPNYMKSYRKAQLSQATQELAARIDQTRVEARRTNRCFRLQTLGGTTGAYKISKYVNSNCTDDPAAIEKTEIYNMAPGARMTVTPSSSANTNKVDFRPPYGINATGLPIDLQIEHLGDINLKKAMRVTGVMGTVVIK